MNEYYFLITKLWHYIYLQNRKILNHYFLMMKDIQFLRIKDIIPGLWSNASNYTMTYWRRLIVAQILIS